MKAGFSLVQIIIFLAIASMMSVVLFQSYFQTNRVVQSAGSLIDSDRRILLLQDRLEKDLMGAFVPRHRPSEKKEQLSGEKTLVKKTPEKKKPLPKLFYSVNGQKNLKELTFITNNPLPVYKKAKPRIVRVRYQLISDENHKGAYKLLRQESNKLEYGRIANKEKGPRAYTIADNIKNLTISYSMLPEKDDKNEQKETRVDQWNSDERAQGKQKKKKNRLLPEYADAKIVLNDTTGKKTLTYECRFPIYADPYLHQKKKQKVPKNPMVRITGVRIGGNMQNFLKKFNQLKKSRGAKV